VGVIIGLYYLFKFALWRIRHAKPGTGIYSEADQEGYTASAYDKSAIGKEGIVETDLKPGGHIIVEGKKHSAISQSGYITKGSKVVVISGQGEIITVKFKKNS
jgi:membrane-bound serine protease (ClpP class)